MDDIASRSIKSAATGKTARPRALAQGLARHRIEGAVVAPAGNGEL